MAITGIAACLVTLSVCFVAVGKKSYFYREGRGIKNSVVINNDSNLCAVNGEEEAYNVIENELGIKPLKLGYMPSDMKFLKMTAGNGHAEVEFMLDKQSIFLTMAKNDTEASKSRISDGEEDIEIENKWIGKELSIKKEYLSAGTYFEAQLFDNGAFYSLSGIVEEKEFLKMVERLIY